MTNHYIQPMISGHAWYNRPFVAGPTECND
jgi:hypothetical protein